MGRESPEAQVIRHTKARTPQPSLGGEVITDSFGNPDFYITVAGDTLATVAKVPGPARG